MKIITTFLVLALLLLCFAPNPVRAEIISHENSLRLSQSGTDCDIYLETVPNQSTELNDGTCSISVQDKPWTQALVVQSPSAEGHRGSSRGGNHVFGRVFEPWRQSWLTATAHLSATRPISSTGDSFDFEHSNTVTSSVRTVTPTALPSDPYAILNITADMRITADSFDDVAGSMSFEVWDETLNDRGNHTVRLDFVSDMSMAGTLIQAGSNMNASARVHYLVPSPASGLLLLTVLPVLGLVRRSRSCSS